MSLNNRKRRDNILTKNIILSDLNNYNVLAEYGPEAVDRKKSIVRKNTHKSFNSKMRMDSITFEHSVNEPHYTDNNSQFNNNSSYINILADSAEKEPTHNQGINHFHSFSQHHHNHFGSIRSGESPRNNNQLGVNNFNF